MITKILFVLCVLVLSACSKYALEEIKSIDEVESRAAIKLEVDKQSFQKDTDLNVSIDVINKDKKTS